MRSELTKEIEAWEDFQKIKHSERRWVESVCNRAITWAEAVDYRPSIEFLTQKVLDELELYPEEEFYLTDAEIESVCNSFLEDEFVKERMSRVD